MSLLFAPCIARIVQWKVWLVSPPKQNCPKQKVLKLHTVVGFCVLLRIISLFLRFVCVRFVCGLEHLEINTLQFLPYDRKKSCIIFLSLGAGRWDHAKTGGAGRNNSVCAVSKSCQTCWPLRNRICWSDTQRTTVGPQAIFFTHV